MLFVVLVVAVCCVGRGEPPPGVASLGHIVSASSWRALNLFFVVCAPLGSWALLLASSVALLRVFIGFLDKLIIQYEPGITLWASPAHDDVSELASLHQASL